MAVSKLVNIVGVASLAVLLCSLSPSSVNALSVSSPHGLRAPAHAAIVHKKRGKRCKPRSSSVAVSVTPTPTSSKAAPTTSTPKPSNTSSGSNTSNNNSGSGVPSNTGGNSGSNGGNGKVGIAWPNSDSDTLKFWKTDKVGPIYTWSPYTPVGAVDLGFEPVMMLWGDKQINDFYSQLKTTKARTVFGPNEPNQVGQAYMTPQHAADLWRQHINPLKDRGFTLVTPACTSAPDGKTWMQQFFSACSGCHFDGVALHWYGTDAQALISYISDFHTAFGYPIWVTEFACQNFAGGPQCDEGQVWNFMKTVKGFMDSTPWVAHYFAFGAMQDMNNVNPLNRLMGGDRRPNALGQFYIGA